MTAQIPDVIEIDGEQLHLLEEPLEAYLRKTDQTDRVQRGISTALRRGYVAVWKVEDGQLYLERLDSHPERPEGTPVAGWFRPGGPESKVPTVADLFPLADGEPVPAAWVTGRLRAGGGDVVHYEHQGYRSIFDRELVLHVRGGRVTRVTESSGRRKLWRGIAGRIGFGLALGLSPWFGLNGSDLYALTAIVVGMVLVYSGTVLLVQTLRGK